MKNKKFQNFRYDLIENIVYHDCKYAYKHLQHIAAYIYCSELYKDQSIYEYLKMWMEAPREKFEFEDKMLSKFSDRYPKLSEDLIYYIQKGISVMDKEISTFYEDLDEKTYAPYFFRNFVFTSRGTINLKKTVCEILKKEDLSPESKFKLACKFYLGEDLIADCFEKLPRKILVNYTASKRKNGNIPDYVQFWIRRSKNLSNYIKYIDSNPEVNNNQFWDINLEDEFYLAAKDRNRAKIQYLWENFISKKNEREEILQKILPDLLIDNLDIFIYLIFQLESNHGEFFNEFFKTEGLEILRRLYEDERWENIFVGVFGIIHLHLEEKNIKEIICLLTHSSSDFEKQSLYYLQGISEVIAPSVKNYLAVKNGTFYHSIIKDLVQNERIQFVRFIFRIIGKGNFNIFLNDEGVKCFEGLVKLKMFSYIDEVMKENFLSEDGHCLKKALQKLVLPICCYYVENDDTENIEILFKWMFKDEKKIRKKINALLYQHQGDLFGSFFRKDDICEADFDKIDNFLVWCLGSEKAIDYKRNIVVVNDVSEDQNSVIIYYDNIKDFVLLRKFKGLCFLFKWCLLNNDKIEKIKKKLLKDTDLLNTIILKDDKVHLESFVSFCASSPHEYLEFQRNILNTTELHVDLIERGHFYAASKLINWCGEYLEEEMQELKERLFPLVITYFVCDSRNKQEFNDFKEWINASWITFIKCHFTSVGINLLRVNENLLSFHFHFLKKFSDFLISLFVAEKSHDESFVSE
ncbi:UNVERIFIED_CONTAM: hypothetical protein RMT77_011363 [Armadillidium vulgare]